MTQFLHNMFLLGVTAMVSLTTAIHSFLPVKSTKTIASTGITIAQQENENGEVLGTQTPTEFSFNVNVPANFNEKTFFLKDIELKGNIIAPNIITSLKAGSGITVSGDQNPTITNTGVTKLQGSTGEITLSQGTGISISGTTITNSGIVSLSAGTGISVSGSTVTNSDLGSSQKIFKTVSVSGQTDITAGSNTDTLTFVAGNGITLTTDATNKKVTVTGVAGELNVSGWSDDGTAVRLATSSDNVGIGTTSPLYKLHVAGTGYVSGATTLGSTLDVTGATTLGSSLTVTSGINNSGGGITNAGAVTGGTGITSSGTITFSGLSTGIVHSNSAGVLSSGAVNLTNSDVTGTLAIGNGGTGLTSYTAGDILYASGTTTLSKLNIGSSGQVLKVTDGIPSWGSVTGGAGGICTDCLVTDPGTTQTISPTASTATGLVVRQATGGSVDIFKVSDSTGATDYLRIDSSGNVLLGNGQTTQGVFTVSPTNAYPLTISPATLSGTSYTGTMTSQTLSNNRSWTFPDASGIVCTSTGNCNGLGTNLSGTGTNNYLSRWNSSYGLENSILYDNGNIGVGTTVPSAKLDVAGTFNTSGAGTIGGALTASSTLGVTGATTLSSTLGVTGVTTLNSTLNVTGATTLSSTLGVTGGGTFGGNLTISGTGNSSLAGNVGIGTTSPLQKLHVEGQCVAMGTLIRRRRRKKNGENEEEDIPVEDIEPGDEVLTLNEETGEFEWQMVEETMDKGVQTSYELITESGKKIETTGNHPYLVNKSKTHIDRYYPDFAFVDEVGIFDAGTYSQMGVGALIFRKNEVEINQKLRNVLLEAVSKLGENEVTFEFKFKYITPNSLPFYHKLLGKMEEYADDWKFLSILEKRREGQFWNQYLSLIKKLFTILPGAFIVLADHLNKPVKATKKLSDLNSSGSIIKTLQLESQGTILLQIADIFLGAVTYAGNDTYKKEIAQRVKMMMTQKNRAGVDPIYAALGTSLAENNRVSRGKWTKVVYLKKGDEIAVTKPARFGTEVIKLGWEKIVSIKKLGRKQMYDLQIANTHNFVGNGIVAHNTYISGNVGIGTTGPSQKLEVAGNIRLGNANGSLFFGTGTENTGFQRQDTGAVRWYSNGGAYFEISNRINSLSGLGGAYIPYYGTVSSPAYAFDTDTNTGMFSSAADAIGFSTGGTEAMTIKSGNVGIGTTGPGAKLDVRGNINVATETQSALTFDFYDSGLIHTGKDWQVYGGSFSVGSNLNDSPVLKANSYWNTAYGQNYVVLGDASISPLADVHVQGSSASTRDVFLVRDGSTSYLNVTNSGYVGIGTTTPLALLDVNGTASVSGALTLYGTPTIASTALQTLNLGGTTTGNIQLSAGSATPAFVLTTAGNIGIGTTAPGAKLEIVGAGTGTKSFIVKGNTSNDSNIQEWQDSSGTILGRMMYNGAFVSASLNSDSTVNAAYGSGFTLSGGWGIWTGGTLTTAYGLQINNSAVPLNNSSPTSGTFLDLQATVNQSGTAAYTGVKFNVTETAIGSGNSALLDLQVGTSSKFFVSRTGNVGIGTTAPGYKLEVNGNTFVNGTLYTGFTDSAMFRSGSGVLTLQGLNGINLTTHASPLDGISITNGGNVGIGTTTPTSLLHVNGAVTGKALGIFNETGDQNILVASASGTNVLQLDRSGNVTMGASLITTATTANIFNTTATTLNLGGAATAINIGATGGTITLANNTVFNAAANYGYCFRTGGSNKMCIQSGSGRPYFPVGLELEGASGIYGSNGDMNFTTASYTPGYIMKFNTGSAFASSANMTWNGFSIPAATLTLTGSTNITTATGVNLVNIAQPTYSAANALTVTNAASLYVANAPTGGGAGPAAITNPYSLWIDAGTTRLDGNTYMAVDSGNVGIGTTGPTSKLHVSGAVTGKALTIFDETGDQNIFTASASGTTQATLGRTGNLAIEGTLSDLSGTTLVVDDDLQINGGDIMDTNGNESLRFTTTTSAVNEFTITNAATGSSPTFTATGGDTNIGLGITSKGTGTVTLTSAATTGTATSVVSDSVTQGTGLLLSADALTTGNGLYLESTSTALSSGNLASLYWNPGSSTTATGDLLRLNIGANGIIGNIFNVQDNGSSVFSVSQTAITSALPHAFTASGDVNLAYDLIFTNQTTGNIQSYGPLNITAGESFESNDIVLSTYNQGAVVVDRIFNGSAVTNYGLYTSPSDSTSNANTNYGIYSSITHSGNAAKTGTGLYSALSTSSTTADTLIAADLLTSTSGIITTGTRNMYGLRSQPASTGASTGGTTNVYGGYLKSGGVVGAGGTINSYGLYIANGTMDTTGTSVNTGLYVESPTGADTNYAAIFAGGNVGIGTTAPSALLHVQGDNAGNLPFTVRRTGYSQYIDVWPAYSSVPMIVGQGGAGIFLGSSANGTSGIRIDSSGNVGIGTTSPLSRLDVRMNGTTPVASISGTTSFAALNVDNTLGDLFTASSSGTTRFVITQNGGVGIGTTNPGYLLQVGAAGDGTEARANAWNSLSDLRFKQNVTSIGGSLDKILQLDGISFDWKSNSKTNIGFIAQDVQKVFPELVSTDQNGILSLNYGGLTAPILNAIKEQQEQLKNFKFQISNLDQKYASISAQLDKLASSTDSALLASSSATLIQVDNLLNGSTATISSLLVTDKASINNLFVGGTLTNGLLSINGIDNGIASIDSLTLPLRLQNNALADVSIMGGKVAIDTKGNINFTEGDVNVLKGKILGNDSFRAAETIKSGETTVTVTKNWSSAPVSVTASASYDTYVWITNITQNGFTLNVKNASLQESKIYWTAIW